MISLESVGSISRDTGKLTSANRSPLGLPYFAKVNHGFKCLGSLSKKKGGTRCRNSNVSTEKSQGWWGKPCVGYHLHILKSSATNVAYQQVLKRTKPFPAVNDKKMLSWAERNLASLSAIHLKGTQNHLVIFLSHHHVHL